MRLSLLYNPLVMIDRVAIQINRYKRKRKLKGTPASGLSMAYIDSLELLELIRDDKFAVKVIFDVGANIGTWTLLAKSIFPNATIHAFEPLPAHIQKFNSITHKLNNTSIHQFCLGNEDTTTVINVSSFSDSSSILNATPLEYEQFGISKSGEETVSVKRTEELIASSILPVPDVIKLDVQGFELEVLKGLGKYLNQVSYLIVEVSFKKYYYEQALFLDIANYLSGYKFNIYAFANTTPLGRELGQIDVLFKKQN
ncbi:MAG: FkbM family methyltransferase [Mucilaginibacter sp.]